MRHGAAIIITGINNMINIWKCIAIFIIVGIVISPVIWLMWNNEKEWNEYIRESKIKDYFKDRQ